MALSSSRLSTAIKTLWTANPNSGLSNPLTAGQSAMLTALCDAIAQALVTEITTNGTVVVTSVSGVTTGGGVSGPGTGTIA